MEIIKELKLKKQDITLNVEDVLNNVSNDKLDKNQFMTNLKVILDLSALNFTDDRLKAQNTKKQEELIEILEDIITKYKDELDKNEKVSAMSKGMIEKLNLVLTFSRNAKLFVLDEPLGGVDPVARERIISTIIKTYNEDSSIIISTHLVNDVENIFDDVCFIGKGKIILNGSAEDLRLEKGVSIDKLYIQTFMDE